MPQNQNTNIIQVLIMIAGAVFGYIFYSNYASSVEVPPLPQNVSPDDLHAFKNLQLDFTFSKNSQYKTLQQFGEFPVNPGISGKSNIFAPFQ